MRGVRIDLTEGASQDQLYTSEEYLPRLIDALNEITDSLPRMLGRTQALRSCFGSGVFWLQQGHAFSASQCTYPEWEGLVVAGGFHFTGSTPSPFADALARGEDELRRQR